MFIQPTIFKLELEVLLRLTKARRQNKWIMVRDFSRKFSNNNIRQNIFPLLRSKHSIKFLKGRIFLVVGLGKKTTCHHNLSQFMKINAGVKHVRVSM